MSDPFYCQRVGLFKRKIRLFFVSRSSPLIRYYKWKSHGAIDPKGHIFYRLESLFFIIKVCKLLLFVNYCQFNNINYSLSFISFCDSFAVYLPIEETEEED